MPLHLDSAELRAKVRDLRDAGYRHSDQYDARIAWLELTVNHLSRTVARLEQQLARKAEQPDGGP